MFNLVRRRFRARRDRHRQRYLSNLATRSEEERRELDVLEEMLKTGAYRTRTGREASRSEWTRDDGTGVSSLHRRPPTPM
jgi:hypothetical protein